MRPSARSVRAHAATRGARPRPRYRPAVSTPASAAAADALAQKQVVRQVGADAPCAATRATHEAEQRAAGRHRFPRRDDAALLIAHEAGLKIPLWRAHSAPKHG